MAAQGGRTAPARRRSPAPLPTSGKRSNRSPLRSAGQRGPSAPRVRARSLTGVLFSLFNFYARDPPQAGARPKAEVPARTPAGSARRGAVRPALPRLLAPPAPRSLAQIC